ncbi:sirohydrochlorin chelatase [Chengkuizengella axinellae]|uniref:CbiX/SirB N-terminal domain-containing protein n=1 Tax=Chengkuizengella axinellae TaxID=3064388 RepID=A0ABT9J649_9BACL|nr:CbiX/SirB N-terminal domain-containing protein [Chengkuizengella sp. 2205SS18-9]MDP5277102.1 CbiX/SirB N-terminal domain-containing protein [Chengkuizengella sp. 2205SS18-9]
MKKYGLLVISHGSRNEKWVRLVDQAVDEVGLDDSIPKESSFLELVENRLIQDGIYRLEDQGVTDIIVIPLFVSSGSTHLDEISYALGVISTPILETDMTPMDINSNIHLGVPVDDDPIIANILYERIKDLSKHPQQEVVCIVGHGSKEKGFHAKWRSGLESLAQRVQKLGGFAGSDSAMLLPNQVYCKMKVLHKKYPNHKVIIVPLFLSEGYFTNDVIPSRLKEFIYLYNGKPILPDIKISIWIEQQVNDMIK